MNRWSVLAVAVSLLAAGCGSDTPTAPTATKPTFTVTMSAANEVPPVVGAESGARGTATIVFNTTVAAGNVTAATADFTVNLTGLPANTTITASHIHPGAAGVNGGALVNLGLSSGEIVTNASGAATITKNGINVDAALAQAIMNNPAGYYFNSHSTANGGGVARGQLVRTQ